METILSTLGSEQNSKQENELILSYPAFKLRALILLSEYNLFGEI